ncbi:uncharacterized protein LOC106464013 [Limulus polyphemus]|uniref:Uncharacterized protein LOC106464013 n=1 Tax=Limulus polyphemus TaxID=6850 RepID=A0ABM1BD52_LIMPO|nr:uncharacterized protein LOC106464013 [Limulus polyphemus]
MSTTNKIQAKSGRDIARYNAREGAILTNERLRSVTNKIGESYNKVKLSLTTMHERYETSKGERNILQRYATLKRMIKDVVQLDAQYWRLLEIPKQELHEQVNVYVLRACAALEKASETRTAEGGKGHAAKNHEEEAKDRDAKARFDGVSTQDIEAENEQLINDLYRLLKKYSNLKNIVHELNVAYVDTKSYPVIPRYTMLKEMIKDVFRDPNYMEVCHEEVG